MNDRTRTVCEEALALPPGDRAALVAELLSSFDQHDSDPAAEEAWREEILRRAADDETNDVDWAVAREHVRCRLSA